MLRRERVFRKVSTGAAAVVLTVGMMTTFSHEANATGGGGEGGDNLKATLTWCYDSDGQHVGYANNCESGSQRCKDTTCD